MLERVTKMYDFETIIADFQKPGENFEQLAKRADEAGMTHVVVTQNPPLAKWLDDYPERPADLNQRDGGSVDSTAASGHGDGRTNTSEASSGGASTGAGDDASRTGNPAEVFEYDPYPSWYNHKLGLLKVVPPEPLQPHVSSEWEAWADEITDVLDRRCQILRRYDLKAAYATNEPQVLPEDVFAEHPLWRGPRVDQPNRSRKPHFAPCVDHPDVREMYRSAVADLLERYPEIEVFQFVTTDAGSGFCWADSLYPGRSGNSRCRDRSMTERVTGFFDALDAGAEAAGTTIECDLVEIPPQEWMVPTFDDAENMASALEAGRAINNFEGPNATRYKTDAGAANWEGSILYPVRGIPQVVECARTLQSAAAPVGTSEDRGSSKPSGTRRLEFSMPPGAEDLSLDVYERVMAETPGDRVEALQVLKSVAVDRVGDEHAETLLSLWFAVDDATTAGKAIPGHPPQMVGGVHQRWITRPFVPFPEELHPAEKRYYRDYLFQARSEEQAEDLVDCQAMRLYKGWGARVLMTFVFDRVEPKIRRAERLASELATELDGDRGERYRGLELRFQVLSCLLQNSRNAIDYQAIRDHVRDRGIAPEKNPVLGTRSSWERDFMLQTARAEVDNTARLIELLEDADEDVVHCADSEEQEDVRLLGPNLVEELERKLEIMTDHWTDYRRLFTLPNP